MTKSVLDGVKDQKWHTSKCFNYYFGLLANILAKI